MIRSSLLSVLVSLAGLGCCHAQQKLPCIVVKRNGVIGKAIDLRSDGKVVACRYYLTQVRLFNLKNGKEITRFSPGTKWPINSIAFHPSKKWLALADFRRVIVWDLRRQKKVKSIKRRDDNPDSLVQFSPNGELLAAAFGSPVRIWDTKTWKQVRAVGVNETGVRAFRFSPDSKTLATIARTQKGNVVFPAVRLWSVRTGKAVATFRAKDAFYAHLAFTPDGKYLFAGSGGGIGKVAGDVTQIDIRTKKVVRRYNIIPRAMALSPDGKTLAIQPYRDSDSIKLFDVASGKLSATIAPPEGAAGEYIAFSPDGQRFVAARSLGRFCIWEVAKLKK